MTPQWSGWEADAILFVGLIVLAVYLWRMARLLADMNQQQTHMRQRIDQLPGSALVTDLRVQLGRMEALGESTQREMHATGARLRRVEDYLMEAKRHGDDV